MQTTQFHFCINSTHRIWKRIRCFFSNHQNIKIMKKYIVKHWAVSPKTFRKTHLIETIVDAYDPTHARLVIDRHPDLIHSVVLFPQQQINIQININIITPN